jgi:glycosyltransferase involved in cell wall biosynthesis
MYCGSCLRDNALAAELMAQGHQVTLVPIYTPTLTDEPNVSQKKVFFGGVSVYLQQHSALFRAMPRLFDRLWDSNFVLNLAAKRSIPTNPGFLGALTVSTLKGEAGFQRKEVRKLADWLRSEPAPDIVSLPHALLLGLAEPLKRALGRPVCCTLQGEDLYLDGLLDPWRAQAIELIRERVKHVDAFIAVSDYYAERIARYLEIPDAKIRVVPIGVNTAGYESGKRTLGSTFTLGYFARVAPEKSLHLLAEAYRRMRASGALENSRLEAAGYLAPEHQAYLEEIEAQMKDAGLGSEFHYRGILSREGKIAFLRTLDVLSVPSTYAEPKGIYLLEAMANGVPVVQPRHGAFPEMLARTGGGLLFEPGNLEDLATKILAIYQDRAYGEAMGRRGAIGVSDHYGAAQMARNTAAVFEECASAFGHRRQAVCP